MEPIQSSNQIVPFSAETYHPVLFDPILLKIVLDNLTDPADLVAVQRSCHQLRASYPYSLRIHILMVIDHLTGNAKVQKILTRLLPFINNNALEYIDDHNRRTKETSKIIIVQRFNEDKELEKSWITPFFKTHQCKNPLKLKANSIHLIAFAQGMDINHDQTSELAMKNVVVQKRWYKSIEKNLIISMKQLPGIIELLKS